MALVQKLERQIYDGPRNVVAKLTGVLTANDITETAVALSDMSNNDTRLTLVGFRVDMVEYSIGGGLEVLLSWNGSVPQQIYPLAGRGRIYAWSYGGFTPDRTRGGYDGSILLQTTGFPPGGPAQFFTIALELVKLYTV